MVDAQYKTDSSPEFAAFVSGINNFFTAIFTVELGINLFANWARKFAGNGWNWLDLFIVVMSLIDFGPSDIPDWLVRLMRAFRVVRLFGRVEQLTKMISAITASLFPMMNAFVILLVVVSICKCSVLDDQKSTAHQKACANTQFEGIISGQSKEVCPFAYLGLT